MLKIYLTNLGKYNEGYLIGEWVTLPVDDDKLEEVKKRIGINEHYEEMFITDYESDIDGVKVNEYSNIVELNEMVETLECYDDDDKATLIALMSECGYTINEAIEKSSDVNIFYDCDNMEDVAILYCEECGILDGIPEHLRSYFDFAAYGRDMSFEGHFVFTNNGNCIEIL